ncbi:calcium-binding protein [Mameliella sp.]|uniref:calcium-binding protein n=1 Tax=Mameliella sp. TaxID=1924940 RepID=UPI003B507A22
MARYEVTGEAFSSVIIPTETFFNFNTQDTISRTETSIVVTSANGTSTLVVTGFSNEVDVWFSSDSDTFIGDTGNDVFYGDNRRTDGDGNVSGFGNDTMFGMAGDDFLVGGPGSDSIDGGDDYDTYRSGAGGPDPVIANITDASFSWTDTDITAAGLALVPQLGIQSAIAANTVSDGSGGTDTVVNVEAVIGSSTDDILVTASYAEGGSGNDAIFSQGSQDEQERDPSTHLLGGAGSDLLVGNESDNRLIGGPDADYMAGRGGDDSFDLGEGLERTGSSGNDTIVGGAGWDSINGMSGTAADVAAGFAVYYNTSGTDFLKTDLIRAVSEISELAATALSIRLLDMKDLVRANTITKDGSPDLATVSGVEQVIGQNLIDVIIGGGEKGYLFGSDNNDVLVATEGSYELVGGVGDDALIGATENDRLDGGSGHDILVGFDGDDILLGDGVSFSAVPGNDILIGGEGSDFFSGRGGTNTIIGGEDWTEEAPGGTDIDVVFYAGPRSAYNIEYKGNGTWKISTKPGSIYEAQTDTVSEVEYAVFGQTSTPSPFLVERRISDFKADPSSDPDVVPLTHQLYLDFETPIPIEFYVDQLPFLPESREFINVRPGSMDPANFTPAQKNEIVRNVQDIYDKSGISIFVTRYAPSEGALYHTIMFTSEKLVYDIDLDPNDLDVAVPNGDPGDDGRLYGRAFSGVDLKNNMGNGDEVFVFMDSADLGLPDSFTGAEITLGWIAESIVHEAGHAMGLVHREPPLDPDRSPGSPDVMDYSFGAARPVISNDPLAGDGGKTQNGAYHIRKYVLHEDAQKLLDLGLQPGQWDESFSSELKIRLRGLPDGDWQMQFIPSTGPFIIGGSDVWVPSGLVRPEGALTTFDIAPGQVFRIIGFNDSTENYQVVSFDGGTGESSFIQTADELSFDGAKIYEIDQATSNLSEVGAVSLDSVSVIATGGSGDDSILGGAGADSMTGGPGDDLYEVNDAGDEVFEAPGEGQDEVQSSINFDLFTRAPNVEDLTLLPAGDINGFGSGYANILTGNAGANVLHGRGGNDTMGGGSGQDTLIGGLGDDRLIGNLGPERLDGSPGGSDTLDYGLAVGAVQVRLWNNTASGDPVAAGDVILNFENVETGLGGDLIAGNHLDNILTGNAGNDTIFGLGGADVLQGGDNDDLLDGGPGNDSLIGGPGVDELRGGTGNDTLDGGIGADSLIGGSGDDRVIGGPVAELLDGSPGGSDTIDYSAATGDLTLRLWNNTVVGDPVATGDTIRNFENAEGGAGDDLIVGSLLDNVLRGNDGNDSLYGLGGVDVLDGGPGNDQLRGGEGNDTLSGGTGMDLLIGGTETDTFLFFSITDPGLGAARDQILDFEKGLDVIDLSSLSVGTLTFVGTGPFTGADQVRLFETPSGSTIVQINVDADLGADAEIRLANVTGLAASDFVL